MKRAYLNLGLAAIVLALVAVTYFDREKPKQHPPLTALTSETLNHIVIDHPGRPKIVLDKKAGSWRITAPVDAPTDPFEVSSVVGVATTGVERTLKAADVDLKELKLDPPNYSVTFNDVTLGIGDSEPIKFRRYVKVGDQVDLVSDPPGASLDADFSDLVAKNLMPTGAQIARIEVPGLTVERDDKGKFVAPSQPDATDEQLKAFVHAWQNTRSMWNAAMPDGAEQAGSPIRIELIDGTDVDLRLSARQPQLILDRPAYQVRYALSEADVDKLLKLPAPVKPAADKPTKPEAKAPVPDEK